MKIVNLDGYTTNPGDLSWEGIEQFGELTTYDRTSPEQVVERAKDADILLINKTVVNAEMLKQMPKLKYVGLQSTGYNVIDGKAAREFGITISNIPAYSTNAVAQLVFAFILEITNKVSLHSNSVHNDEWVNCPDFCYWKGSLTELDGKTIGIIGFGSIGKRVSNIATAFGLKVNVYTPHPK
ncbi:MAG: D-2-hydroxyacid dehydrogenase, partial [Eubacterium sp.]|nr:D-2-hydroxyacid dehydrogenase [Eubacterium sp.]